MNLSLKEYIELKKWPKLSYHVSYSDFFEKQYEKFSNDLIGVFYDDKPISFYCWNYEYDEFFKLVKERKLTYNDQIINENENLEYLIEYSLFFEKGFNSLNDNTPSSVIINNIPFCSTQKCINPEIANNRFICIGRKIAKSKPCIAGMRPASIDSLFGQQGLLSSIKINNVTNERVLKNPKQTAYQEGIMFKSIFQVIERYIEFSEYFEINDKPTQHFIETLLSGIRELQTQDINAECIRDIKQTKKRKEAPFRNWFKTFLSLKYDSVNAEPEKGKGRIDLKIEDREIGTKIIEFKGWWNPDKKKIAKQIGGYLTDFEEDGYIIMINHNKNKSINENYLSLIKTQEMGYIKDSLENKKCENTDFKYYISKHWDGIRTKTLSHFILNVY